MILNEGNVKQLKLEISNFIEKSENRIVNKLVMTYLGWDHLEQHFKSGNNKNLTNLQRCFKQVSENPDKMEQLNWYERYKGEHKHIETSRINVKDRFSFIRRNGYIFVMSLLEHPEDYNYYKDTDLTKLEPKIKSQNWKYNRITQNDLDEIYKNVDDSVDDFIRGGTKDKSLWVCMKFNRRNLVFIGRISENDFDVVPDWPFSIPSRGVSREFYKMNNRKIDKDKLNRDISMFLLSGMIQKSDLRVWGRMILRDLLNLLNDRIKENDKYDLDVYHIVMEK